MNEEVEAKRHRSPEHPIFDLHSAIERAEQLYNKAMMNWLPVNLALQYWDYSPKSSWGKRAVAALKHYGLLEEDDASEERRVKLTPLAQRIIRDKRPNSEERKRGVREAALNPKIYREVWEEWSGRADLPSGEQMAHELEWEWKFNPNAIEGFIRDFNSTIDFANLKKGPILSEDETDSTKGESDEVNPPPPPPTRKEAQLSGGKVDRRVELFDLSIPLLGGGTAVLSTPRPLSEDNFQLLHQALDLFKGSITQPKVDPEDGDGEAG